MFIVIALLSKTLHKTMASLLYSRVCNGVKERWSLDCRYFKGHAHQICFRSWRRKHSKSKDSLQGLSAPINLLLLKGFTFYFWVGLFHNFNCSIEGEHCQVYFLSFCSPFILIWILLVKPNNYKQNLMLRNYVMSRNREKCHCRYKRDASSEIKKKLFIWQWSC